MSKRARMSQLAGALLSDTERAEETVSQPEPENQEAGFQKTGKQVFRKLAKRQIQPRAKKEPTLIDVHREYGERGDFEKITVTIPTDVRAMLLEESVRRKKDRSADWPIAAIVREAIAAYLSPKQS